MNRGPYLSQRNGIYYFRRAVPAPIKQHLGRRELFVSLGTCFYPSAMERIAPLIRLSDLLFSQTRTEGIIMLDKQFKLTAQKIASNVEARLCEAVDEIMGTCPPLIEKMRGNPSASPAATA